MADSEMVERVAKAIRHETRAWRFVESGREWFALRSEPLSLAGPMEQIPETTSFMKHFLGRVEGDARRAFDHLVDEHCAAAAIFAMRELTDDICETQAFLAGEFSRRNVEAFIDAALAPNPPADERGTEAGESA